MALSQVHKTHLELVAENALNTFDKIEAKAGEELRQSPVDAADVLVDPKNFTGNKSYQGVQRQLLCPVGDN